MDETCKNKALLAPISVVAHDGLLQINCVLRGAQVQKVSYEDVRVTLRMRTHLWPTIACFPLGIACQNKTSRRETTKD
jgi:hypothetical protein